ELLPYYRYQVTATVKGTLFRKGQSWTGPWTSANGNGPIIVDVPPPDGAGVTTRALTEDRVRRLREVASAPSDREVGSSERPAAEPETAPHKRGEDTQPLTFLSYQL